MKKFEKNNRNKNFDLIYMTDNPSNLKETIETRKNLYPENLREKWKNIEPQMKKIQEETILEIMGHEVMSDFEVPYMQKLAEIVTRKGGEILNVGYGLGIIDAEIEKYRECRGIKKHYVVELNKHIAAQARKNKNLIVIEDSWESAIKKNSDKKFDGIVYDAYPLNIKDLHRDGISFIKQVAEHNILKKDGILTFYADTIEKFGESFLDYVRYLGFYKVETEKVFLDLPSRKVQYWRTSHFIAPILYYTGK